MALTVICTMTVISGTIHSRNNKDLNHECKQKKNTELFHQVEIKNKQTNKKLLMIAVAT